MQINLIWSCINQKPLHLSFSTRSKWLKNKLLNVYKPNSKKAKSARSLTRSVYYIDSLGRQFLSKHDFQVTNQEQIGFYSHNEQANEVVVQALYSAIFQGSSGSQFLLGSGPKNICFCPMQRAFKANRKQSKVSDILQRILLGDQLFMTFPKESLYKSLSKSLTKSLKESASEALKKRLRGALPLSKPLTNSVNESLNISLSKSLKESLNISLEKSLKESTSEALNQWLCEALPLSKPLTNSVNESLYKSLTKSLYKSLTKSLNISLEKSLKESTSRALKQRLRGALPLDKSLTNSVNESLNISLEKSLKKSLKSSLNESLIFYKGKQRYDILKSIIGKAQESNYSSLCSLDKLQTILGSKNYLNQSQLLVTNHSALLSKLDMRPFNLQQNIKNIKEDKSLPFVPDEMISFQRHDRKHEVFVELDNRIETTKTALQKIINYIWYAATHPDRDVFVEFAITDGSLTNKKFKSFSPADKRISNIVQKQLHTYIYRNKQRHYIYNLYQESDNLTICISGVSESHIDIAEYLINANYAPDYSDSAYQLARLLTRKTSWRVRFQPSQQYLELKKQPQLFYSFMPDKVHPSQGKYQDQYEERNSQWQIKNEDTKGIWRYSKYPIKGIQY